MTKKISIAGTLLLLAACHSSAVNVDRKTTFLTGDDAVAMTDLMARKLATDPKVMKLTEKGPITIVLWQVGNETNEIIKPDVKWLFVNRIAILLSRRPELSNRFRFVLNRADYLALSAKEGFVKAGGELATPEDENRLKPDYYLTGTFSALTNVTKKTRDDYYLCRFELTRFKPGPDAGEVIWTDAYETRKEIKKEFLD
jgi:hypothetical protein